MDVDVGLNTSMWRAFLLLEKIFYLFWATIRTKMCYTYKSENKNSNVYWLSLLIIKILNST